MSHVSKNITFDSDGVYRWAYELNLYKNPTILFLIWKIFGGILLALWLFMVVLEDAPRRKTFNITFQSSFR